MLEYGGAHARQSDLFGTQNQYDVKNITKKLKVKFFDLNFVLI
jgi:hypothetical protein